jgi:RNA polymerase sigma factor (sigma-70 family)
MEDYKVVPDIELVANLRKGQQVEKMVKSVYHNHYTRLTNHILQNSGSRQDAEDVFQEAVVTFIEMVQKDRFRGESSVGTFLYSINRHIWLNELKRRGKAAIREIKYEKSKEQTEAGISHFIEDREQKSHAASLVAKLGDTCKKILLLFYYENRSMKEIMSVTDYENEQVVRNKKYKCLKQLEQMLNEKPELIQTFKN